MPGSCDCHVNSWFAAPQYQVCCLCSNRYSKQTSLANIDRYSFICYMTVCSQALQQQATWQRLQPHSEAWCMCDMQGGPRGWPNCSWPQQSQGGQRRHHFCSVAGNLIHPLAHSLSPSHPITIQLLARSLAHSPTYSHAHPTPSPTHLPTHQPIHPALHSFRGWLRLLDNRLK